MTLAEGEHLVDRCVGPVLESDHLTRLGTHLLVVSWVLKLPVLLVARALARVLAAVEAIAEAGSLGLLHVLPNMSLMMRFSPM